MVDINQTIAIITKRDFKSEFFKKTQQQQNDHIYLQSDEEIINNS